MDLYDESYPRILIRKLQLSIEGMNQLLNIQEIVILSSEAPFLCFGVLVNDPKRIRHDI